VEQFVVKYSRITLESRSFRIPVSVGMWNVGAALAHSSLAAGGCICLLTLKGKCMLGEHNTNRAGEE
jgi:hypothetical protein